MTPEQKLRILISGRRRISAKEQTGDLDAKGVRVAIDMAIAKLVVEHYEKLSFVEPCSKRDLILSRLAIAGSILILVAIATRPWEW